MSGGGAQSALIGATGDSELYYPYLESIGAAMTDSNGNKISDEIAGEHMTSFDYIYKIDAVRDWLFEQSK